MVNDTLYVTTPDNAWALDARDGRELWHYFWKTRGGTHIANRGFGMWKDYLYMETPDNYLVSLEAKTGKERWHKEIASFNEQYFSTMAPIVVGNHVIAGTGNDLDTPGFLQSFDPRDRRAAVEALYGADERRRSGPRHLAQPRRRASRRRAAVAARRLRSGNQAVHLRHRQPDAGLHAGPRRGRQPVHELAGRGQRRHRQDGVVLPDLAARHARLGLGADADPDRRGDQRQAPQAGLDRRAQRLLLHRRSRDRRARRHDQVRHRPRTGGSACARTGRSSGTTTRIRRSAARWSPRRPAARSTGNRRPTTRTPACST